MKIANSITRFANTAALFAKKNAPAAMVVGAIASISYGIYSACKATLKLEEVVEKHEAEAVRIAEEMTEAPEAEVKKANVKNKVGLVTDVAKLYAVPAAFTLGGFGLVLGSHGIMAGRLVQGAAAYEGLNQAFGKYRTKVKEVIGDTEEYNLYHGIKTETAQTTNMHEDGSVSYGTTTETYADGSTCSPYDRIIRSSADASFYDSSLPELTEASFKCQVANLDFDLEKRGRVLMDEIYKTFGTSSCRAAHYDGYRYNPNKSLKELITLRRHKSRDEVGRPVFEYEIHFDGVEVNIVDKVYAGKGLYTPVG